MSKSPYRSQRKSSTFYPIFLTLLVGVMLLPALSPAIDHPTTNPYETRPSADGKLPYLILPIPDGLKIEKDVMIPMPDGIKLACNVVRPDKPGKFAVVLAVTPSADPCDSAEEAAGLSE